MTNDERRDLAGELADDLAERGLDLLDVELLAPLVVDKFRLAAREYARAEDSGLRE